MITQDKQESNWQVIVKSIYDHHLAVSHSQNKSNPNWRAVISSQQAAVYYNKEQQVFVKIFFEHRLKHKIKNWLLPSTARHTRFVEQTELLHKKGISAPKILQSGLIEKNGYVVTDAFAGMGLGDFFARYLCPTNYSKTYSNKSSKNQNDLIQWRRNALKQLGEVVANLHNAGIAHGDLRPNNILLHCYSTVPKFCFIDNERNAALSSDVSSIIKNLVQLNMIWLEDVGLTDRFRFFSAYIKKLDSRFGLTQKPENKKLLRQVQQKTIERLTGKPKDGYRKPVDFEPFKPDFQQLLNTN